MSSLRELYEEEARTRGDAFSDIYSGVGSGNTGDIPGWAYYYLRLKQVWLEETLERVLKPDDIVLDAGCAAAYLSNKISRKCRKVYNLDISSGYLELAVSRNNTSEIVRADIQKMPFADKSMDVTVCSEALEHVPGQDEALEEIRRVTKRVFVSTVPLLPKTLDFLRIRLQGRKIMSPGKGHIRNYQIGSYLSLLKKHGFTVTESRALGLLWWRFSGSAKCTSSDFKRIYRFDSSASNKALFRNFALGIGVVAVL